MHGVLLTAAASILACHMAAIMACPHPCLVLLAKLYCKVE